MVRQQIREMSNVLGGRFVPEIKNKGTNMEVFKAQYLVHVDLDRDRIMIVYNTTIFSEQAIRLLISVATFFGSQICSEDMTQAYPQGDEQILRKVYIRGKLELQLEAD